MYKQLIIARKDLNMSPGKLAAQVAHGSMAFLATEIRDHTTKVLYSNHGKLEYECQLYIDRNIYNQWFEGSFTKIVCEAKNKNHLLKAATIANEIGLREGIDYFLIRDNCLTELTPEEDGRTLTVIGFRPLDAEIAEKISKRFQLWH